MAVLTASLTRLRSDFNTRFPGRDKASDGWIGDQAHQGGSSGHNPDESGNSEYEDSDSKDEVRAIDVDKDLRDSGGITMQQCCDAIRSNPDDRKRIEYIIFNRRICSQSSGWAWQNYSGSNPHDQHAHFSGDPGYDEDDSPFQSILNIGRENDMTPEEMDDWWISRYTATSGKALTVRNYLRALGFGVYVGGPLPDGMNGLGIARATYDYVKALADRAPEVSQDVIDQIEEAARQGAAEGAANTEAIVAGVLAGIEDSEMSAEQRAAFITGVEEGVRAASAHAWGTPLAPAPPPS